MMTNNRIFCREIRVDDIASIIDLLACGFPNRSVLMWERAFQRLLVHRSPSLYPRYGYLLEHESIIVGVLITIFSTLMTDDGRETVRCNLSSWYVRPDYRAYAAMLSHRALRHREVTYLNITPHPATLPILEAQGYQRYCNGVYISVPGIKGTSHGKIKLFDGEVDELSPFENKLLLDHANYGGISVICSANDRRYPFVFAPDRICRAPAAYLTYCRNNEEFVRFAGALGRFLAWRGHPLVILDADRPIPGLAGKFYDQWPKYFKGPDRPRHGDLAYTERPIFGF